MIMSKGNKNKGVQLINSRTPAEAKEHRREVLEAVHECKVRGFSHQESTDALRQKFNVTRDMAREYISWYKQEKQKERTLTLEEKRRLVLDRFEFMYGKAIEAAEATGDYKQAIDINDKMGKMVDTEEKRLAQYQPEVAIQDTKKPLSEYTPRELELLRLLYEARKDNKNTSAIEIKETPAAEEAKEATE
jgi:hypothetical protein